MPLVFVNLIQSTGTKGGLEIYARELYRTLGGMDTEFRFLGFASRELAATDTSWFPGEVIDSGISGENRFAWAWAELFTVGRAAARHGADLLHGPAMLGPLRSSMPAVITFHDLLYFTHPELMQTKAFTGPVKWMERRAARNATRVLTISETSARAIRRYLHVADDRIDVIPLAGRTSVRTPPSSERRDDLFLAIGQRSPYKDFETVVRAWAQIPEERRPQLVVTGSFGEDPLIPVVQELDLARWVTLREWVSTDELAGLYATATALIDSTKATGFSLPTLEAMSIGLPVLMADTEIFREVGADAVDFFAPGDPSDLARAAMDLVDDAPHRVELRRRGLERAASYSWERVATETLESFRAALAAR